VAVFRTPDGTTPAQLTEDLAAVLVEMYAGVELQLTELIAARLRKGLKDYPDLLVRLRTATELRKAAQRILDGIDTNGLAEELVRAATEQGMAAAAGRLAQAKHLPRPEGLLGIAPAHADAVALVALDLQNAFDGLHSRILRNVVDDYQRVIASMQPPLLLGNTTWLTTQQRAVSAFLNRGLTGFTDASGRSWRIGTYSEMATRTATARAWNEASIGQMQNVGVNLVTPVVGRGACKRCAAWAGKVLSTDGTPAGTIVVPHAITGEPVTVTIDGMIEEARAAGLHHPNCGCVDVAHMPGLADAPPTTYDPELEKQRADLRALERDVRALKRELLGAADEVTATRIKQAIKAKQAAIREHVANTGETRQGYREQLGFSDGRAA
jgi:hypothetical protein